MTSGQGFLLVYSITSRTSFDEIQTIYQQILQIRGQDAVPMILVANKCELEYERQVSWNGEIPVNLALVRYCYNNFCVEGHDLANLFGCQFVETSAKLRINVDEAFGNCVQEIRRREVCILYCVVRLKGALLAANLFLENKERQTWELHYSWGYSWYSRPSLWVYCAMTCQTCCIFILWFISDFGADLFLVSLSFSFSPFNLLFLKKCV